MSQKSEPTRWGILGAGQISHDWSVAMSTLPPTEHKIVAVAARNAESAQKFAKLHGIPKVHKSYEDLAKDPEIDVVYIGVIHTEHLRIGKMVLDNGKHLLCEKPLCMNVKETKELVDYARKKKLFMMEAIWSRFFPAYFKLREELEKGTIGEVMQVRVEMGLAFPEDNWRRSKEVGGGTVLDMGTYTTQFTTMCFSGLKPLKIVASGHLNESGADDSSSATIIFPKGKTGTLITHSRVNLPSEALVVGTKGSMKLNFPFWAADKLETPSGVLEFPVPKTDKEFNFWNSTGLSYQCQEVRRCIQAGITESPLMSLDETILIAEIKESIRKQIGVSYPQD
ncbi:Trans-1,2-dihydrobenzene-1,2-diol dehydrogenase [Orchesella cincta]|uniref:Trans-1,2-dihydrobenzene-1,2-diol dehydrogenase n=1 Tax=Orchesella cincta TaxID=48709 RepID=A0A1D2MQR9_ORCCI|nr:Trans-1,2-dihydrobenzene-1,2-diol dehydrogenase [Orchesella cincta]